MKRFIEVTLSDGNKESKILINTEQILSVTEGGKIFLAGGRSYYLAQESYEEIKKLIRKSQPLL